MQQTIVREEYLIPLQSAWQGEQRLTRAYVMQASPMFDQEGAFKNVAFHLPGRKNSRKVWLEKTVLEQMMSLLLCYQVPLPSR